LRERLGGEWWLTINLEVHEVGGVRMSLMGWGYGRILGGVGGSFQVIPYLKWEMALRLDFDMIYGVGMWHIRKPFQIYMVLLVQRMLLLWLS